MAASAINSLTYLLWYRQKCAQSNHRRGSKQQDIIWSPTSFCPKEKNKQLCKWQLHHRIQLLRSEWPPCMWMFASIKRKQVIHFLYSSKIWRLCIILSPRLLLQSGGGQVRWDAMKNSSSSPHTLQL